MTKITVKERLHKGFLEWRTARKKGLEFIQLFGHCQWVYSSEKGKISLVHIKAFDSEGFVFEAYCLEGNLFDGTECFFTKEKADKSIREYLS